MEKSIEDYIEELKKYRNINRESSTVFNTNLTGTGFLTVEVTTAQGAYPIIGAKITVTDNENKRLGTYFTDESGKTEKIPLPTYPALKSESPGTVFSDLASRYDILTEAEKYIPLIIKNIPVFDGVVSIQNAQLTFSGASDNSNTIIIDTPLQENL